jgi:hypothetical protein
MISWTMPPARMAQIRRDPASEVVHVSPRRDFRPTGSWVRIAPSPRRPIAPSPHRPVAVSPCRRVARTLSAKQRRFGLRDDALVSQEVVGDDVVNLFDLVEQAVGQGDEFVGLENAAWALVGFQEERIPI